MGSTESEAFQKNNCHFVFDTKVVNDGVLRISAFVSLEPLIILREIRRIA